MDNRPINKLFLKDESWCRVEYETSERILRTALEANRFLTSVSFNENDNLHQPLLKRNEKRSQCAALLASYHKARKIRRVGGSIPKELIQLIVTMAFPDFLRENRVNFQEKGDVARDTSISCMK